MNVNTKVYQGVKAYDNYKPAKTQLSHVHEDLKSQQSPESIFKEAPNLKMNHDRLMGIGRHVDVRL